MNLSAGELLHGSSPYCENTSVPVHALILLKQAPENSIRELTGFEKVQLVSNNIIYPTWLEMAWTLPGNPGSSPDGPARLRAFLPSRRGRSKTH